MGACRESFDLFNRHCWRNLIRYRLRRWNWRGVRQYIFRDTFTRFICMASGGCEFSRQPDPVNEPEGVYCHWCRKRNPLR